MKSLRRVRAAARRNPPIAQHTKREPGSEAIPDSAQVGLNPFSFFPRTRNAPLQPHKKLKHFFSLSFFLILLSTVQFPAPSARRL